MGAARGGVTAFLRLRRVEGVEAFCHKLVRERGTLLIPGVCFDRPEHVRLGFGGPTAALAKGLARLSSLLREAAAEADRRFPPRSAPEPRTALHTARPRRNRTSRNSCPDSVNRGKAEFLPHPRRITEQNMVNRYTLSGDEIRAIKALLAELTKRYRTAEDDELLKNASVYAHELPRPLRFFLNDFKCLEPEAGACVVSGYPVAEDKIGETPPHWNCRNGVSPALEEELLLLLLGSLLGDAIGWATQQDGYILHDVLPIKEYENSQLGTGSLQKLWWHSEDAFHPYRGDYLGLMCLRNPDSVSTVIGSISQIKLDAAHVGKLFEARFNIRPDESHSVQNNSNSDESDARVSSAYGRIHNMNTQPESQPVLFGDPASPSSASTRITWTRPRTTRRSRPSTNSSAPSTRRSRTSSYSPATTSSSTTTAPSTAAIPSRRATTAETAGSSA